MEVGPIQNDAGRLYHDVVPKPANSIRETPKENLRTNKKTKNKGKKDRTQQ